MDNEDKCEYEEPLEGDCCGNGCSPCVYDIYRSYLQNLSKPSISHLPTRTDLLSKTRFKPFKLIEKNTISEFVVKYKFQAIPTSTNDLLLDGVLPYGLGQHLIVKFYVQEDLRSGSLKKNKFSLEPTINEDNPINSSEIKMITRAYTPITIATSEKDCCFEIFLKHYEDGLASQLFRNCVVNDVFYWRGPIGNFQYKVNSFSHILIVCMGSGLAPFISLINSILNNDTEETVVHLIYGVKNIHHIIMRDLLKNMCRYWNFTLQYYFSQDIKSNSDMKFGESFKHGRIDRDSLKDCLANKDLNTLLVLICGSDEFTDQVKIYLEDIGLDCKTNMYIF